MQKSIVVFILIWSNFYFSYAQKINIQGVISEQNTNNVVEGASVVIKSKNAILGYAYSNEKGFYNLQIHISDTLSIDLEVNSLGFEKVIKPLVLNASKLIIYENIQLKQKIESLSTVVIKSDEKMKINRDTIAYRIEAYKNGSEKTVEDMLKKLPGIEVADDGTIRALGQPIKKILIEGDDLANTNYKVISKNLDVSVLKSIDIVSNYQENPVLKQFLNSQDVVINLKLKNSKKSILFGKLELGLGVKERYNADINLGLINSKFKFLNLGFLNNVGKTAGSQYNSFNYNASGFNDFDKTYEVKLSSLIDINGGDAEIDDKNYIENKSFSNSFLLNKKLSENAKLRNTLFVYKDDFDKNVNGNYTYIIEPEPISFSEKKTYQINQFDIGNDIEITYSPSEEAYINFKNKINISSNTDTNKIIFDDIDVINQHLDEDVKSFDSQLQYTQKTKKGAFVLDNYMGIKNSDQKFTITPNTLTVGENGSSTSLYSKYKNKLTYFGTDAALVVKKRSLSQAFTLGVNYNNENINTKSFDIEIPQTAIDTLSGDNKAQNITPHAQFKMECFISERLQLNTDLDAQYSFYKQNNISNSFLLPNASLSLSFLKRRTGMYSFGYQYTSKISSLNMFLDNYLVKSYRSLSLGADEVRTLKNHHYYFSHAYKNINKRIFVTTMLSYYSFENQLGYESQLDVNSNISKSVYIKGQKIFLFSTSLTGYIDAINVSVKTGYQLQYSLQPSLVNNQKLDVKNKTHSVHLGGTSYFKGDLNFKFLMNYLINKGGEADDEVTNKRFKMKWDFTYKLNAQFIANFVNETNIVSSKVYNTNAVDVAYSPKEKNWTLGLRSQNIFNDDEYVFQDISSYLQVETVYKAVPRYAYLYYRLRF